MNPLDPASTSPASNTFLEPNRPSNLAETGNRYSAPSPISAVESDWHEAKSSIQPDTAAAGRNYFWIALHTVIIRIGWIFKTESIIMPAVLDLIGGSSLLRGCLPMLNRFGQMIGVDIAQRRTIGEIGGSRAHIVPSAAGANTTHDRPIAGAAKS